MLAMKTQQQQQEQEQQEQQQEQEQRQDGDHDNETAAWLGGDHGDDDKNGDRDCVDKEEITKHTVFSANESILECKSYLKIAYFDPVICQKIN
ncbi:Hypothetical predicted protein [Octopus vulgaris]|uniref:Uncharacterized protein n=1 Tax=Octopus vulgaris TaxID=6645 RepID=A0AA36FDN8_OCTVU|nr:Hypothetical predicted protein [Octopus vulgaris]